jgi:hypothetical protein
MLPMGEQVSAPPVQLKTKGPNRTKQERAAILLAEDSLGDEQVAA